MMPSSNLKMPVPKLYCLHYNECDPKKCTSLRLKKFSLLKMINSIKGYLKNSIILVPLAQNTISINDKELILKYGLMVIDCSWKKLKKLSEIGSGNYRSLPPLIAANPVNYGKWEKLSSAEALAAALYITEFNDLADLILSKFHWGLHFKELNKF